MQSVIKCLVLRPGESGAALANDLNAMGVSSKQTPAIEIIPRPFRLSKSDYDYLIFTSPNAVLHSQTIWQHFDYSTITVFAIGSGTASELNKLGVPEVLVPEHFNSEGLLQRSELQNISSKQILIIKGEGGRTLLAETLTRRGAGCDFMNVYQRQPTTILEDNWTWFYAEGSHPILTAASIETLESFDQQRRSRDLPYPEKLLVASERIAELAKGLGYTEVINVAGAANTFFMTAFEEYLKTYD